MIFVTGSESEVLATLAVGTGLSDVKYTWNRQTDRIIIETFVSVGVCGIAYFSTAT
jgi:hypothetical protein